ncbi:prepilin-type N-terminal cleavage/methylation domain-containing protein [Thermosulfurimonas sp. F29]|uniref:prepilin-type N-terminal cleavage/methylation domain-containing protein n=1 Tax=Thermosulfurimonas sp. F29 TaxID=2867247 RepID=UPI001C83E628|nr:prepilin-type N-terminal cleavage/methylation domain-containing protein [Thermosulfurimonas sp. F29]MBX6424284.1 prepilin-type N-terminal cleavage/methylation domain-containing protein [Thermosulfurimonas sp. F29]
MEVIPGGRRGFTLIELLAALVLLALIVQTLQRAHFYFSRALKRGPSLSAILQAEGLRRELHNIYKGAVTFQGRRVQPFFLWTGDRLVFITTWASVPPVAICYFQRGRRWFFNEHPLKGSRIEGDPCEGSPKELALISLEVRSAGDREPVSEITPGVHGNFILHVEGTSLRREIAFSL